jgi:DNA-binding LytR/AlgR family response regulator
MIKAVAIDDEPLALQVIQSFCGGSEKLLLEKTFTRPNEGLDYLNHSDAELVFLDIQMPSLTGLDLARALQRDVMIIFTTAYDNFALEGFNLNAIDYLLKPFTKERFEIAVDKAIKYKAGAKKLERPYITVRADYSLVKIELSTIKYIEGLDDYIKIHIKDAKTIVTRLTMKGTLEMLPPDMFTRVHRSYIVPTARIKAIKNKSVILEDAELPLGQSFEENVLKAFNVK